jgi:NAD(P)-dependent dehydrogenase (short-subunit alcohol dehydrogenase family)
MQLHGKVAVITGAGSGIGEAAAELFASVGANVIIADWNETEAKRVAEEINLLETRRACQLYLSSRRNDTFIRGVDPTAARSRSNGSGIDRVCIR